jgi:WD40 repeat protein
VNPYDEPVDDAGIHESGQPDREANPRKTWTFQSAAGIAIASMRFLSAARHIEKTTETGISPADGPINHMQFSPDGKWLVACGRHTSWIFAVDDEACQSKNLDSIRHADSACIVYGRVVLRGDRNCPNAGIRPVPCKQHGQSPAIPLSS